ncbi:STAS domain-containing protein [Streptomyces griseoviridis]|uniref:Anti-anti-sigma factor n=2 Tax=Streptomyces TaxID=1883 RepID=A0A3Q9L1M2_STRGD|nr:MULTISPECIES: STAS domain-containing protein [Streptomyces]AZS89242.1 anti-sigma factor antagonist [Streptomyces griseoviridis]MDH6697939.1 anti-sigma B factor antagonist [Streptomyces sp. MAA16]MDT0475809.1 STAS domain-containing protein [Streptomyces sp. DSM 41014]QCN83915.1 anti-anti-sigma factor [Streptomyces griseoviridis]
MAKEREDTVTCDPEDDSVVVRVRGDIDAESAPLLKEALRTARRSPSVCTVVDLSATEFADSSILHVLLEEQETHRLAGRPMVVAGPFNESIERLFEVTGTTGYFVFTDDVTTATEAPRAVTER